MHLMLCVADGMGLLFNGRRLSRDRVLCARLLELSAGHPLRMTPYSAALFPPDAAVTAEADPIAAAAEGEFVFLEELDPAPALARAERLTLFHWNRAYPADRTLPELAGWTLCGTREFAGSSHPRITEEEYRREKR